MIEKLEGLIEIKDLKSSQLEDVDDLIKLSKEAITFVESHKWCKKIESGWFERGWGDILAVFIFKIEMTGEDTDDYVWTIVGDFPPAYIDTESAENGAQVIEAYIDLLEDWIYHAENGKSVDECYPFNIPNEKKYIDMLEPRIDLIKSEILSQFMDEI